MVVQQKIDRIERTKLTNDNKWTEFREKQAKLQHEIESIEEDHYSLDDFEESQTGQGVLDEYIAVKKQILLCKMAKASNQQQIGEQVRMKQAQCRVLQMRIKQSTDELDKLERRVLE